MTADKQIYFISAKEIHQLKQVQITNQKGENCSVKLKEKIMPTQKYNLIWGNYIRV